MAGLLQSSVGLLRWSKTRPPGSSRLSRQIVAWVFFSLLVIEGIIFVPSYLRRRQVELRDLEQVSEELLFALKASAMGGQDIDTVFSLVQAQLKPDSVVRGAALYKPDGTLLRQFGDAPDIDVTNLDAEEMRRQLNEGRSRYDVAWPSNQFQGQYVLAVRHDATGVQQAMVRYALAIAGLVVLISLFVTLVTILVLERLLINPLLYLRDDLLAAGEAASRDNDPDFHSLSLNRNDELGDVAKAFRQMFERVSHEIDERRQVERALLEANARSERLLHNVLPVSIAEQLLNQETGMAIASRFDEATILFADIVDFTGLAAEVPPTQLVQMLDDIFSAFDAIADRLGLEKIKTIGDAYMVVGGLPTPQNDHANRVMAMAIAMLKAVKTFHRQDGNPFCLRIGINTGPVVAGVIGTKKFSYDLWGDAVNIASRLESHGLVDRIQVSETTYQHLQHLYSFEERGCIDLKGRGLMRTYLYCGEVGDERVVE
ncbi:adenylate/guanylate cyclase domain-containing protein [Nodosilinea sp. LEGE 07088]|uniref:adenylate/guanylate cyclase domain-containing protein n=1 Tax=Nodosilinea sp. LEGE 07088 TaxID=2777968 RepID=UPI00187FDEC3|nr:adenylate/guanylate cyclase domain-containing protein [Nodosilinea sp. LEGE 07088]MBE9136226.1 adenylate/guanylate cyclase domain-containing protein [Nodosilinea sp. LEGE 07088]